MTTLAPKPGLDAHSLRGSFPALHQAVHGHPLVYLDSAATAQKPQCVIDAVRHFYERDNANVHRGVHLLSQRATDAYEEARRSVAELIGAEDRDVVFTRGTSEAINLVAWSWGLASLKPGDEVLLTGMEHHSNIVPWQLVAAHTGAVIRVTPLLDDGSLDRAAFTDLLSERTRIVAAVHVSNALGTVNPIAELTEEAHGAGALMLVDGAQAVPHAPVDVAALGCDFYAVSGHKMYGPTGIGVLWGRRDLLEQMPPWQGGGEMIRTVSFAGSTYAPPPGKFEAGTPNIAGAVGMGAAARWLLEVGVQAIARWEDELLAYGTELLTAIDGVRLVGTAPNKAGVLSFVIDGIHPHDVGTILDRKGIAVRTGHHCAQPVMERFGVPATTRASLAAYNVPQDLERLAQGVREVQELFAR